MLDERKADLKGQPLAAYSVVWTAGWLVDLRDVMKEYGMAEMRVVDSVHLWGFEWVLVLVVSMVVMMVIGLVAM